MKNDNLVTVETVIVLVVNVYLLAVETVAVLDVNVYHVADLSNYYS